MFNIHSLANDLMKERKLYHKIKLVITRPQCWSMQGSICSQFAASLNMLKSIQSVVYRKNSSACSDHILKHCWRIGEVTGVCFNHALILPRSIDMRNQPSKTTCHLSVFNWQAHCQPPRQRKNLEMACQSLQTVQKKTFKLRDSLASPEQIMSITFQKLNYCSRESHKPPNL